MTEPRRLYGSLAVRTETLLRRPLVLVKCYHLFNAVLVEDVLSLSEGTAKRGQVLTDLKLVYADAAFLDLFQFERSPALRLVPLDLSHVDDLAFLLLRLHLIVRAAVMAGIADECECTNSCRDQPRKKFTINCVMVGIGRIGATAASSAGLQSFSAM